MNTACELPGLGLAVRPDQVPQPDVDISADVDRGEAILAGGCFWCTEAIFRRIKGVQSVQPGYAGGQGDTANYKAVCSGTTGHAEVIRISYQPEEVSYGQLLQVFFAVAHDATQLNRQGNDVGTQYRSAIFPVDEQQKDVAVAYIEQLKKAKVFSSAIATTIEPLDVFFVAENYHHNYAELNPGQSYIQFVSMPKVEKLEHYFQNKLKP